MYKTSNNVGVTLVLTAYLLVYSHPSHGDVIVKNILSNSFFVISANFLTSF